MLPLAALAARCVVQHAHSTSTATQPQSPPPMEEDGFQSISWDDAPPRAAGFADMSGVGGHHEDDQDDDFDKVSASPLPGEATASTSHGDTKQPPHPDPADTSAWQGRWMSIEVKDPVKEHQGSKDMYVSYAVHTLVRLARPTHSSSQTNLPTITQPSTTVRRRFQDFVFLHDNLLKSFPACIIPPIPDKHRLGMCAFWGPLTCRVY